MVALNYRSALATPACGRQTLMQMMCQRPKACLLTCTCAMLGRFPPSLCLSAGPSQTAQSLRSFQVRCALFAQLRCRIEIGFSADLLLLAEPRRSLINARLCVYSGVPAAHAGNLTFVTSEIA